MEINDFAQILLELTLGITLSASAGFRVFLPPLILGLAAFFGHIQLGTDFQWASSPEALILLGIATVAEIIAYYIPVIDNVLDTVKIPLAIAIGTLLTANSLGDLDPVVQWTVAIIAGGGASGAIATLNGLTRVGLTGLTGGLTNFLLATAESIGATALTLIVILVPILAPFALLLLISLGIYLVLNYQKLKERLFPKNERLSKPTA